jgi:hypothetical protein
MASLPDPYSRTTHVEGRAVDLAPWDWQNKLRVLKDLGFVAWYRPYGAAHTPTERTLRHGEPA